ncbi:MAG: glycoside hydrolase family 1 protein [Candidatus Brennerbacteria bacterium]
MNKEPFYFGASSSAHQVEGGQSNDWTEWEARTGHERSGRATDHWSRYEEDFDIAKKLGHNAHRFSIEWSRIEPEEGRFDEKALAHYRDVVRALRKRGMEPFVTLWHFTLPQWVAREGGWESEKTAHHFARYVGRVAAYLKDDVKFWMPLNEPEIYSTMAYLVGKWPPAARNPLRMVWVLLCLARAHRAAYAVLKGIRPEAQVGIAKNHIYFEAIGKNQWNEALKAVADWGWNFFFLDRVKDSLDFIGVNFYFHNRIDGWFNKNKNERVSDMGWELLPETIFHALKDLNKYKKPMYVTENGLADAADRYRAEYICEALEAIAHARREGVEVRGYLHWALTDNFEWADGFVPRFGLVEIDYKTLARHVRPSALAYRDMIKKWPNR